MFSVNKIFVIFIFVIFVNIYRNLFLKFDFGEVKFAIIWLYGGRFRGFFVCIGIFNWVVVVVFFKINVFVKIVVYKKVI